MGQGSSSDLSWSITSFVEGWKKLPCEEYKNIDDYKNTSSISGFIRIVDSPSAVRGKKNSKKIEFLCKDAYENIQAYVESTMIPINVSASFPSEINLESYNCTVNFKANGKQDSYKTGSLFGGTKYNVYIGFKGSVVRNGTTSNEFSCGSSGNEQDELRRWIPISFNCEGYHGHDSAYGWWPDENGNYK